MRCIPGENGAAQDHEHLVRFCERHAVEAPRVGLIHFSRDFGPFRLKWERHGEFVTYTSSGTAAPRSPFGALRSTRSRGTGRAEHPAHAEADRRVLEDTRVLVSEVKTARTDRLVAITGFGAGDSWAKLSSFESIPYRLFLGTAYDDRDRQEAIIRESGLDWLIVRPTILTNRRRSGRYRVLVEPQSWRNGLVSRADVADFLIREAATPQLSHVTPLWPIDAPASTPVPLASEANELSPGFRRAGIQVDSAGLRSPPRSPPPRRPYPQALFRRRAGGKPG